MNSKIKQLEMRIKLGTGDEELDLVQSAALRDLMKVYESHINTLTAERDEARKEIERLKEKCEHKSQQVDSQVSIVSEMQSQVTTLTEENKRLHDESEVSDSLVLTLQEEVKMLAKERDEARRINNDTLESSVREVVKLRDGVEKDIERLSLELAELRSAPGMDEVESACEVVYEGIVEYDIDRDCEGDLGELCDIARRAIASRGEEKKRADEVVGLLKWMHSLDITLDDGVHPVIQFADPRFTDSKAYAEFHRNAKRILEIVEGK